MVWHWSCLFTDMKKLEHWNSITQNCSLNATDWRKAMESRVRYVVKYWEPCAVNILYSDPKTLHWFKNQSYNVSTYLDMLAYSESILPLDAVFSFDFILQFKGVLFQHFLLTSKLSNMRTSTFKVNGKGFLEILCWQDPHTQPIADVPRRKCDVCSIWEDHQCRIADDTMSFITTSTNCLLRDW